MSKKVEVSTWGKLSCLTWWFSNHRAAKRLVTFQVQNLPSRQMEWNKAAYRDSAWCPAGSEELRCSAGRRGSRSRRGRAQPCRNHKLAGKVAAAAPTRSWTFCTWIAPWCGWGSGGCCEGDCRWNSSSSPPHKATWKVTHPSRETGSCRLEIIWWGCFGDAQGTLDLHCRCHGACLRLLFLRTAFCSLSPLLLWITAPSFRSYNRLKGPSFPSPLSLFGVRLLNVERRRRRKKSPLQLRQDLV